ncbi:hypothetical protein M3J09_011849 [Ascochyta lentis]
MSTPLVDIDANPRQPGFRAIKDGSKISSPPKFQQSDGTSRRSPFSVSTTGSPCYTVMPPTTKVVVSPTPTSRLPRKSTPSQTQSAFSKSYTYGTMPATPRSSVPRFRGGLKHSAIAVPIISDFDKANSPLYYNKPLPSPPVAQLVNPQSPPKAQRTLVDAEAGSPTEEEWPILQPENVSQSKTLALPTSDSVPQRSMSEGSALRRNGTPALTSRLATCSSVKNCTPSQKSSPSTAEEEMRHEKFRQMTEPRTFSSMNPYAKSFHAFSTNTEAAIDSPLAYKRSNPIVMSIPPRTSSKRGYLPLSDTTHDEVFIPHISDPSRSVKPGSIKWPILETATEIVSIEKPSAKEPGDQEQQCPAEAMSSGSAFSGPMSAAGSHYGSIDGISMSSLVAGPSLSDESEVDYEGSVRVKRLSWHSSNPNSGPTLRISAEADAVILGRDVLIPAVPALPRHVPERASQERSLSTLAGHFPKQILVKMIPRTGSRSLTPSSGEIEGNDSKPVKVTPIRSMQPPRKPSTKNLSKGSTSPFALVPAGVGKDEPVGDTLPHESGSLFKVLQEDKAEVEHQNPNETHQHSYEAGNYSTTIQVQATQKAVQMLATDGETPLSATQKRLPMTWMKFKSATTTAENSQTKSRKTSLLPSAAERFNNRALDSTNFPPSPASSDLEQSDPPHTGAHHPDLSGLRAMIESPHANDCREEFQHSGQNVADVDLKIKAKRSFRNIFHRRDLKPKLQPAKKQDSKRSSVAGSVLTQRIRDSTNFSKTSLARPPDTNAEVEQSIAIALSNRKVGKESNRKAALSALDPGSLDTFPQPTPIAQYDTATVLHNILDRVTSMRVDSPDRLRGLEIAEAVLHAVECSKEAKVSAELARKHARDAELNAERAGVELKRLEKLCEPGFGCEVLQAMKQLITAAVFDEISEAVAK